MNYLFKNEDELKEYIKNSYKDLKKNIDEVKEMKKGWDKQIPFPDYAINNFEDLSENYKNLDKLNKSELRNLFRDIEYTDKLMSSKADKIEEVANKLAFKLPLEYLSPQLRQDFWELYGKIVGKGALLEQFKYDTLEEIKDLMFQGVDLGETFESFRIVRDEAYELEKIMELDPKDRTEDEQRRLEKAGELNVSNDKRIYIQAIEDLLL